MISIVHKTFTLSDLNNRGFQMKNALLIALALTSVTAFAAPKATKAERRAAREACKTEGKTKKEMKSCIKGKLASPATAETAAPASAAQ